VSTLRERGDFGKNLPVAMVVAVIVVVVVMAELIVELAMVVNMNV
jgi:hypothetical protein